MCDEETVFDTLPQEPRNYKEALASEDTNHWLAAMSKVMQRTTRTDPLQGVKLVHNM